jgi:predicted Zn finger-like uncharacterized protein
MYSQCPQCLTVYKLAPDQLALAHGRVRCGTCAEEFDALERLTESLPQGEFERLHTHDDDQFAPLLTLTRAQAALGPARPVRRAAARDPRESRRASRAAGGVPSTSPPPPAGRLACLALLLRARRQLAYAGRAQLLAEPELRPLLGEACRILDCRLPPHRDLSQLALLARDIRPHPSVRRALIISATLANRAPHAQPYPIVEIDLADADQNRIAMRRFQPEEYVSDREALKHGMDAGAATELHFEVADPGKSAVAFEFSFL